MIAHYSFLWAQDDNVMTEQKCHFIFGDTLIMSSSPCELFFFFLRFLQLQFPVSFLSFYFKLRGCLILSFERSLHCTRSFGLMQCNGRSTIVKHVL